PVHRRRSTHRLRPELGAWSPTSAPIVAIDDDIFLGEVAGPDGVAGLAETDPHPDRDGIVPHIGGGRRFRIGGVAFALHCNADIAEPDGELVTVGWLARLAYSH